MRPSRRLFVAVYPPADTTLTLLNTLRATPLPKTSRPVPAAQVHLTLQFIGDTPERDLAGVEESVRRSASGIGPFVLHPRRLMTLPEHGHPRLVAAETDSPAHLLELQRRLAGRLARQPRPRQDFRPHLTLCRFDGNERAETVDSPIDVAPFEVSEVVLVQSVLRPTGAQHIPLVAVALR
jgi:RNA 2',3'-cyclic 3'-phosphodiesterase